MRCEAHKTVWSDESPDGCPMCEMNLPSLAEIAAHGLKHTPPGGYTGPLAPRGPWPALGRVLGALSGRLRALDRRVSAISEFLIFGPEGDDDC
jgi:hypothetical protein